MASVTDMKTVVVVPSNKKKVH